MTARAQRKHVNKNGASVSTKRDLLFYALLLILPLAQIAVFYFGVNFQSFFMAFQQYDKLAGAYVWNPAANWNRFVSEAGSSGFWTMVWNSVLVYLLTTLAGTVLAVLYAYYVYKRRTWSNFFKFLLFLPSVLPSVLLVIMYQRFVGQGIPTFWQDWFGVKMDSPFKIGSGRVWLVTLFTVWVSFGSQVLVYTGAMDQIPTEEIEAAALDGCGPWREFASIIVPSIFPSIGTFLIAGVAGIFTNQNNLFNFLGQNADPSEQTIGYYLYVLVYADGNQSGYCYAAFLGLLFTLIVVPLAFLVRKGVEKAEA